MRARKIAWKPPADLAKTWTRAARGLWQGAVNLLYPVTCVACDVPLDGVTPSIDGRGRDSVHISFCADCEVSLIPPVVSRCRRCALPIATELLIGGTCGACVATPPRFDVAWALGDYRDNLREAVLTTKRSDAEPWRAALAGTLAARHGDDMRRCGFDAVVAVPMHWRRRWWRGGNGVESLGRHLAKRLGLPFVDRALVRRRHTLLQSHLPHKSRRRNVRGAFRASPNFDFAGAKLLLVDDILTTGATCGECAKALLKSGAKSVGLAVIARARPDE
jgi:ComF family protein